MFFMKHLGLFFLTALFSLGCTPKFSMDRTISSVVTPFSVSIGTPSRVDTNLFLSVNFPITITGAASINLTPSDVNLVGFGGALATDNCIINVTSGTTENPIVNVSRCFGGQLASGLEISITLNPGFSSNAEGTLSPFTDTTERVDVIPTGEFETRWAIGVDPGSGVTPMTLDLPLKAGYNYNAFVDWGDGSPWSEITFDSDPDKAHTYGAPGNYTVMVYGLMEGFGAPPFFGPTFDYQDQLIEVPNLGDVGWRDLSGAFFQCTNLTSVSGGDTSLVTNFEYMFRGAVNATVDSSTYDTSSAINMNSMFTSAQSATPDTTNWDTSNVTDMGSMFAGASVATPDTTNWNTSSVTNMSGMFSYALAANPNTTNWNTSSVEATGFSSMFFGAALANPDTTNWDISGATIMWDVFRDAVSATPNTRNWNTSNVISMNRMFTGATSANPDVSLWDVRMLASAESMFDGATSADPDVSMWQIDSLFRMGGMFHDAISANPDLSNWDFNAVTSFDGGSGTTGIYPGFIEGTAISNFNYTNFLIQFEANITSAPSRRVIDVSASYQPAAAAARANLISAGWIINDGGPE